MDTRPIVVVGAGVIGLSSAIRLAEEFGGRNVDLVAEKGVESIVSGQAAAVWYPFLSEDPRIPAWSAATLRFVRQRVAPAAHSGVLERPVFDLFETRDDARRPPAWAAHLTPTDFRRMRADELARFPAVYKDGWRTDTVVVDTSIYMPYLRHWAERLGVRVRLGVALRGAPQLAALAARARLLVNCTGLGARELCNDARMRPVRGQIVVVRRESAATRDAVPDDCVVFDEHGPNAICYVIPRTHDIVLGGTAQRDDGEAVSRVDEADAVLRRVRRLYPQSTLTSVADARVTKHYAGLRPFRDGGVRLEREGNVVHNYGHGGSGFTVSFGCADDVVALARDILRPAPKL